jgi:hypothetical protein
MSESKLAGCLAGSVRELHLAKRDLSAVEARELAAWLSDTLGASDALWVLDLSGNINAATLGPQFSQPRFTDDSPSEAIWRRQRFVIDFDT